jgi:trehalose-6-phosphate synthase
VARNRIASLYRASKVGLVTPLRDGMNVNAVGLADGGPALEAR